ncbi:hypothetical protein PR048_013928 [Dryococelus australis]|uniref:Uncharacterized protein n=1 Tax=Dryococelus australis TaxID=614101 RepID=A0ABQ9HUG7_9NEOP|nr:hypothetical protein PR048_013928 [Dryococelus australis]
MSLDGAQSCLDRSVYPPIPTVSNTSLQCRQNSSSDEQSAQSLTCLSEDDDVASLKLIQLGKAARICSITTTAASTAVATIISATDADAATATVIRFNGVDVVNGVDGVNIFDGANRVDRVNGADEVNRVDGVDVVNMVNGVRGVDARESVACWGWNECGLLRYSEIIDGITIYDTEMERNTWLSRSVTLVWRDAPKEGLASYKGRRSEVSMERRRNERSGGGGTGDPRENPPDQRHRLARSPHAKVNPGERPPASNQPRFAWVGEGETKEKWLLYNVISSGHGCVQLRQRTAVPLEHWETLTSLYTCVDTIIICGLRETPREFLLQICAVISDYDPDLGLQEEGNSHSAEQERESIELRNSSSGIEESEDELCSTGQKWQPVKREIGAFVMVCGAGMGGRGKREDPEKARRPKAASGTIPTCEGPVTWPRIEPGSSWWEASRLTSVCAPPVYGAGGSGFESQNRKALLSEDLLYQTDQQQGKLSLITVPMLAVRRLHSRWPLPSLVVAPLARRFSSFTHLALKHVQSSVLQAVSSDAHRGLNNLAYATGLLGVSVVKNGRWDQNNRHVSIHGAECLQLLREGFKCAKMCVEEDIEAARGNLAREEVKNAAAIVNGDNTRETYESL